MRLRILSILLLVSILATACGGAVETTATATNPLTTQTLPPPDVNTTQVPDVELAARAFLDSWQAENYDAMYDSITRIGQDAISREDFIKKYKNVAINLTMQTLEYRILSTLTNPGHAQATFEVTFNTALFTQMRFTNMTMNLALENGAWKVQWEDALILPDLKGGNYLGVVYTIPPRGSIFDRDGEALVSQADAVALGIWPGKIPAGKESRMLRELSNLTGKTPEAIKALYENAGDDWYIAVGEAPAAAVDARANALADLGGAVIQNRYSSRFYFDGGVAPHVTGYVQPIFAENLEEYRRKGYRGDEKVGMAGLESWGEQYLAGTRGASLYVYAPDGTIVTKLAQVDTRPAQDIITTIDREFQLNVQRAIEGFRGAVVVLEKDTGRVLAMASAPGFDPNLFEPANENRRWLLDTLFDAERVPLLNRAAQGGYPLGSVFKIITMAAALESGLYTKDTRYMCGYEFNELPGITLYDWTYEKQRPPSGDLNLPEGLMRSCNPYFWHIGLDLFNQKGMYFLSNISRGFGVGTPTGIVGIEEYAGNLEDPQLDREAVQMAIGQGTLQVTPLQVATWIAAIGNGGTIFQPQVIEKINAPDGSPMMSFTPIEKGKLPVSEENLKIIQDAMRSVVANQRGTAYRTFSGLGIRVYGKTGTAQTDGKPHAWFGGYTETDIEGKPDIAIVVLVEKVGEGSEYAAPIFRRVVEYYFYNRPGPLYPWESTYFVTQTPTDLYTKTPTERPPATATPPPPTNTPEP